MHKIKTMLGLKGRLGRRDRLMFLQLVPSSVLGAMYMLLPVRVMAQEVDVCGGAEACNTFIETYINPIIVLLTILVGIAAVISIIAAGIQYSSSADDPGVVNKAKQRVLNTVIGLVAYIFLLAFLNYLVPGGLF